MPEHPVVKRGCVVVYVDEDAPAFRRALAIGPVLTDPGTELDWVPLARPDGTVAVIDFGAVVDVSPADAPAPISMKDPAGPVGVLAAALDQLATELMDADREDPAATHDPLATFARTVAPVQAALALLAEADPDSGLHAVLSWLACAANEHDIGNQEGTISGVLIADTTLKRMIGGATEGGTPFDEW